MPRPELAEMIDRLEALAKVATPGEWEEVPQHGAGPMIAHRYETGNQLQPTGLRLICHMLQRGNSLKEDQANAAFIALANPSTILKLCAEIRRLEARARTPEAK